MTSNNPQNDLFVPLKHVESIILVAKKLQKQTHVQWWEENGMLTAFRSFNPELVDELRELAVIEEKNRARKYDFDPIAWKLRELEPVGL